MNCEVGDFIVIENVRYQVSSVHDEVLTVKKGSAIIKALLVGEIELNAEGTAWIVKGEANG